MKIEQIYSHLNGEEYLIVHHENLYDEIKEVISGVDAENIEQKLAKREGRRAINFIARLL
jgi:hypothetical protein